jgi:ABC-2 type transport system ATP-binding protein
VVKRYGDNTVIDHADFSLRPGITGLIGANGAGKTTLISMLLGLRPRDGGDLEVLGLDPQTAGPELRMRIGFAPEHHDLPPDVTANDLVRHLTLLHGIPAKAATERANDTLWLVGLGEERFRPIGSMSTGQRQRVKLASAIAHDPELAMLDEPTDGLDPMQRSQMLDLIARIGGEFGISVLLSSHRLREVEQICDDVVVLRDGRVLRSGALSSVQAETGTLIVDVDIDAGLVVTALAARGHGGEVVGPSRLAVPAADGVTNAICASVSDLGAGLRRLESRRGSLEDLFADDAVAQLAGVHRDE